MSITQRQKQIIKDSFSKVEPISDLAAEIFYAKLFEYDPSLKRLFKSDMKQQGRKLMATLNVAVNSLDDMDALVPILQNLAKQHLKYGVKMDDYTPVGNALIFALGQGLQDAFTDELKQAWITLYKIMADVMRSAAYPEYNSDTYSNNKHYKH